MIKQSWNKQYFQNNNINVCKIDTKLEEITFTNFTVKLYHLLSTNLFLIMYYFQLLLRHQWLKPYKGTNCSRAAISAWNYKIFIFLLKHVKFWITNIRIIGIIITLFPQCWQLLVYCLFPLNKYFFLFTF